MWVQAGRNTAPLPHQTAEEQSESEEDDDEEEDNDEEEELNAAIEVVVTCQGRTGPAFGSI